MSLSFADLPAAKSSGLSFDDLPDKNPLSFDDLPDAKRPSFGNVQSGGSSSAETQRVYNEAVTGAPAWKLRADKNSLSRGSSLEEDLDNANAVPNSPVGGNFGNVVKGGDSSAPNTALGRFMAEPASNLPKAALAGLQEGGAAFGKYLGLAAGGAAGLFDDVAGTNTQAQVFKSLVEPEDKAAQFYADKLDKMGAASQVVGGVTKAVPDVIQGLLGGVEGEAATAAPKVAQGLYDALMGVVGTGAKMAAPLAEKSGADAYGQAITDGKAPWDATTDALKAIGSTEVMGLLGSGAEGNLVSRVVQSGAAAAGTSEAIREMEGRPFNPVELGTNLAIGGAFGVAGHDNAAPREAPRAPVQDAFQDIPNKSETVNVPPGGFSPDAGKTSSPDISGNVNPQKTESKIPPPLDRQWVDTGSGQARTLETMPGAPAGSPGAISIEVRSGPDDNKSLEMYVAKDGSLVPTEKAYNPDNSQHENIWTDGTPEQKAAVKQLLHDRAQTPVGSPERAAFKQRIADVIAGKEPQETPTRAPQQVETSVGTVTIDRNSDVPYLGGSNGKGTVYLDKDFNPIKTIGGKQVDVTPYLAEHEAVEAHLEDQGWSYTDAHEQATKYEHQKLRDDGIDPAEYETALKGDLKNTFSKPDAKPPSDIIEKPYDHPHTIEQRKVLDEVKGNEAQQPPQEGAHPLFDDLVPKTEEPPHLTSEAAKEPANPENLDLWEDTVKEMGGKPPKEVRSKGSVLGELQKDFGSDFGAIKGAINNGKLRIISADQLPDAVKKMGLKTTPNGWVAKDGSVTIVADNLAPGYVRPLIFHEIGAHAGLQQTPHFPSYVAEVKRLVGEQHPDALRAVQRVKGQLAQRKMTPEVQDRELVAYFVQHTAERLQQGKGTLVDKARAVYGKIKADVKNYLNDKFGMNIRVTDKDMHYLALGEIKKFGRTPELRAPIKAQAAPQFDTKEEKPQRVSRADIDAQAKAAIDKGADPDAVQKRQMALYKEHGHDSEQGRDNGPAPTSTKNAVRDAERAAEGRDPIIKAASQSNPETLRKAQDAIEKNPNRPAEVIQKLNEDGVHSISAEDEAVLLVEKVRLRNARDEASKTLSDPNASEEAKAVAQVKFTEHEAAINMMDQATEASGREWGRFGQFRQQMLKNDYSFDAMERRARGAKGGPLSPEEAATVKEDAARVKDAQNEVDRTQTALSDKGQVKATYDNLVKEMAQQLKTAKKKGNFLETLKKNADDSRAWLKKSMGQLNSGVDPTAFYHLARIGAYHIANGAVKFKDWVVRMKAELGSHFSKVEDAMPAVFKAAKSQHDLGATETKPRMKAKADLDPNKITHKDVYDLARAHIINGVHGEDAVMKAVHGDLAQHGLSERDVRRLFSEYGEVKFPSNAADKTELRELRSLVQMQESIDRLHEGLAALKSGPQRDKATQVVREKRRQLNDLLKAHESKNGMSPEKLATFQEARARNLRNQIEDLQKEIATGEKKVRKAAPADNEEVASLKKERDGLREQLKAIEAAKQPPRDLDQEARDRKVASIEKEVADLERRIKERDFSEKEKSKPVTSPRIEELRQQRDALKKQYDLYKPLPPTEHGPVDIRQVRADAEKSRLTKRIAELQDKIAKRDVSEPGKVKPLRPDAELVRLRKEKAQLEKDLENMKPGPAPTRPKNIHEIRNDQRRKALAKQIEKLTAELNGEIAQKSKPSPDDAATAAMKQQRDKLREQLRAAEAARNPPPSPEEKYQAARAKSIKQQMEAIYKRIENNDYAVRTKPDHELNKANKEAAYKLYQAKNLFARHQFEMQMSQRAPLSKLWGGIKEAQNLGRAIMTSVDLSATLRQGGFVALGHPIRAAHALAASVHAMKSERNAYAIQRDIETRPNFELYKRAGLDLTLSSGHALGKQEEQFMSRWVEHMDPQHNQPIRNALRTVKNAALAPVRGSERAFKTFINKLRADSFDTMLAAFAKDGSKPTKEELKAIANYINVATGRGRIGKNNAGASGLSTVFFAPRLVASRFNLLAGQPLYGGSAKTRTMILGEYARYLAGVGVVMGLGQMSWNAWGNKKEKFLELDPRSANFMKMHFGNTYIDPLSGLGQVTTFVARELAGENKNQRGEIVPLRPDFKFTNLFRKKADMSGPRFGQSTGWDVAGRFARTKFAPVPGMFIDIASGTNVVGQPVSMSNEAVNLLTPMSLQQVQSVMQEHGIPAGTAMTLLDLLGMSVQQRTPYKKTPKPVPPPEQ